MTEAPGSTTAPPVLDGGRLPFAPAAQTVRDIARGGIAGIIVGVLVAGLGGRLVMRIAAILHEDAVGATTEAGEIVGRISVIGTLALIMFGGLGMGLVAGTIWVIVSPWIPGRGLARALATAVAAIAIGTPSLVQLTNFDFVILDHDRVVVGLLVGLVGLVGFSMALVDGALDARLPHPPPGLTTWVIFYVIVALIGMLLVLPAVVSTLMDKPEYRAPIRAGWALAAAGACTLALWLLRLRGQAEPPKMLRLAGAVSLLVAVILGAVTSLPHILAAAGLPS